MLTGVDEVTYLKAFLTARYNLLYNYDKEWRDSVMRVTIYQKLVASGDYALNGPIYVDMKKHTGADGVTYWQILNAYYGRNSAALPAAGVEEAWVLVCLCVGGVCACL